MRPLKAKRPHGQLRQSQLITTFGPGAMVDLPRHSVIIAGLDEWKGEAQEIIESRLNFKIRTLLNLPHLRFLAPPVDTQDPFGSQSGVIGYRFPEWFITQDIVGYSGDARRRFLVRRKMLTEKKKVLKYVDDSKREHTVVPVRFVRACRKGHIGDLDWYGFVHGPNNQCGRQNRQLYIDEFGTSGDLSQLSVGCDCGSQRRMSEAVDISAGALGFCGGERPWLGQHSREDCNQPNRLLVRTASNAYFPHTMSVISLPERDEILARAIDAIWENIQVVENIDDLNYEKKKPNVREVLAGFNDEEVLKVIKERREGDESVTKTVKQAELEILLDVKKGSASDVPDGTFYARTCTKKFSEPWMGAVEKVVLIHRLREVIAQIGFTRFEAENTDIDGELSNEVERASLALEADWLPAIENKGEGFFIAFKKETIEEWVKQPQVEARGKLFEEGFRIWAEKWNLKDARFPGLSYVMLHSLSHLLITAVSMECGYPSSSIRERVYSIPEVGYGILLYTGSSDAEGTLGGLVEAGKNINRHLRTALANSELCSNDPVCAQHLPDDTLEQRHLLGAACHGCLLIAETSCERFNQFLDRSLVIATVEGYGTEFFRSVAL